MIVIMGAAGATGGATLRRLAALGAPGRALTRDPARLTAGLDARTLARTTVLAADAADPDSLRAAFRGARALFLTMANGPHQVRHELNAVQAAADCGVEHVVKVSAPAAEPDSPVAVSRGHHLIEERLRAGGMTTTVLRPYAFMQKLLLLAPGIAAAGVVHGATGAARCNYVDVRDIGDAAAALLTRPEPAGGVYPLTGGRAYSHRELTALLGDMLGRPVRYLDLSPSKLYAHLVGRAGMPPWLASHVVEIQQLAVAREETPDDTFLRLTGRAPRTMEAFLHENLHRFR
ncbi:NmrA family NAD(P)-binding protein [Streptomyces lavendulae]|uniref:NmrA family NAD(P)-binding protein n=1 Tax=Streptomyces lavendulae TaxID=1914 RepID=UPI0024A3837D|nr:NmrA family NAD(P)-binding protein [Streptomyces lavendulae]GLX21967.1 NAD(P)-dependent oxidoreductase [Streptomyces lavendulae subsp. lavendulae]GLX29675.1 NAD(P)-dependent oxidoreductase [Streptomyces lavendulae subsp. lavendulae]